MDGSEPTNYYFIHFSGRDGQNYTARAIYPCFYDPDEPDFVVINFDPDKTLMLLIFFAAIPGGILTFSCFVCSVCSRFIHTGDDGHMRLKCCGKYVTGIGMCSMAIWVAEFLGKGYKFSQFCIPLLETSQPILPYCLLCCRLPLCSILR